MEEEYILHIRADVSVEGRTTFREFMSGLRDIVETAYGRQLPANDHMAINMFRYAGSYDERDNEFRDRQGYAYYHDDEGTYTCVCTHKIKDLYFIVPKWSKNIDPLLAVGSTCIKRFQIKAQCYNCHGIFYIKPDKDIADICCRCSKCPRCSKGKKQPNKTLCSDCLSRLKDELRLIFQKQKRRMIRREEERLYLEQQKEEMKKIRLRCFIQKQNHHKLVKNFHIWKRQYQKTQHQIKVKKFIETHKRKVIGRTILKWVQKMKQKRIEEIQRRIILNKIIQRRQKEIVERIIRRWVKDKQRQTRERLQIEKQNKIQKYDIKKYPRTSTLIQYWDRTYDQVFKIDRYNSDHPKCFKEYVNVKEKTVMSEC